jgi:hypothetical protein
LCILCSRIVNSTISRPKKKLVAFMKATLLGEPCTKRHRQTTRLLKSLSELQMDWLRSEELKVEKT